MSRTKELLTARLKELTAMRDAIHAKSGPLREARDRFANEARAKEMAMNAEIKVAEDGLYEICNELGMLAKATGGRSMSDTTRR